MTPNIVLGPPGTGKTTTLLAEVDAALAAGVRPERIGYFTFTRRGAQEAVDRAVEKFGLDRKSFPYFRTLHSLCFRELNMKRGDVFEGSKLAEFSKYAGVRVTGRGWSEDGVLTGFELGDRVLFAENLSRVRMISLREQYDMDDDGVDWHVVNRVSKALAEYKRANALVDYTDMLLRFIKEKITIPFDLLVIDEAQDLSLLQWKVVEQLATKAKRVVVAGDDDQAIYRWAGADVEYLIDLRGESRVLGQSYRVPPAVQSVANDVISEVAHRREKTWKARTGGRGKIDRAGEFGDVDVSGRDVLVLARNSYVLKDQIEPELRRQGIVYEKNGHSSIKQSYLEAIEAWETLRKGKTVTVAEARQAYEFLSAGVGVARGFKKLPSYEFDDEPVSMQELEEKGGLLTRAVWHEAMDRLPPDELSYMLSARRRGERFRKAARVRVATIHGSKGGEADHVILMKEMAGRTFREMEKNPEDEARVWYVGVTRAREKLTIVESMSRQSCPWL